MKKYKGAGILLLRHNGTGFEALLGRRAIKPEIGKWSIPGGRMESKDISFRSCAEREFLEETGININAIEHKNCSFMRIYLPYFSWQTYFVLTKGEFPKMRICHEFSEVRWIPLEEVSKQLCSFALELEINKFKKYISSHELAVVDYLNLPFEDQNLLKAYKLKRQIKGDLTPAKLQRVLNIGFKEAERIIRRLEDEQM